MGIFGGGYEKPGKGVDKNEPKKKGFFLFFDILIRKFTKFLGANCLYTLTSIIWIALLYFLGGIMLSGTGITGRIAEAISAADSELAITQAQGSVMVMLQILFAVSVFTLWGSGPSSAAYAYINRCFTRGEHTWIMSDGADKFKENFKQGMFVVIADAVVLIFGLNAMHFYYTFYVQSGSILWMMLTYIVALVFIIYTMMHPYLYQIMVTFECKIGSLYKNALLITLAKLPGNFFLFVLNAAVIILVFTFFNPFAAALIITIFGLCITRYPCEFYAARVIERSILKDLKKKSPKIEYIEEEETE